MLRFIIISLAIAILPHEVFALNFFDLGATISAQDKNSQDIWLPEGSNLNVSLSFEHLSQDRVTVAVTSSSKKGLAWKKYTIDRDTLFNAVAVPLSEDEEKARDNKGKQITIPKGARMVAISNSNSFPGYVYGVLVDKKGKPLVEKLRDGLVYIPRGSYITSRVLNEVVLPDRRLEVIADFHASDCERLQPELELETQDLTGRTNLLDSIYALKALDRSPFAMLRKYKSALVATTSNADECLRLQRGLELKMLEQSNWGKLSIENRARKVYSHTQKVYDEVKAASAGLVNPTEFKGEEWVDPHIIDPLLSPELAVCISYTESELDLNPYGASYAFCRMGNEYSDANGLGHVIGSTLKLFRGYSKGNLIPLVTKASSKIKNLDPKDLQLAASAIPEAQTELMMRVLNYELKRARENPKFRGSESAILNEAVFRYDTDAASRYVSKVFSCYACTTQMRSLKKGDPNDCYQKVKEAR